ncbi:hypothetical protein [Gemmiger qucibialis]|uniref:hypothetical protein n=1 Tax=Gemmiger qucibialis TaxID=2997294 RepID=UPI0022E67072|nr:hypothetical protein [Gemmiger qucibialis]
MLDKTSSIICAFGLASAAPRSPYRHLELCGITYNKSAIEQIRYFDQLERLSLSNRALSGSTGIFPKARRRVRHAPPREQPSGLIASL